MSYFLNFRIEDRSLELGRIKKTLEKSALIANFTTNYSVLDIDHKTFELKIEESFGKKWRNLWN